MSRVLRAVVYNHYIHAAVSDALNERWPTEPRSFAQEASIGPLSIKTRPFGGCPTRLLVIDWLFPSHTPPHQKASTQGIRAGRAVHASSTHPARTSEPSPHGDVATRTIQVVICTLLGLSKRGHPSDTGHGPTAGGAQSGRALLHRSGCMGARCRQGGAGDVGRARNVEGVKG